MKKTISLILCVAMLMSSLSFCFPALALELDFGVESNENYAPTIETAEEATLAGATDASAGDPGINLWTGTTAAFNFDSLTADNIGTAINGCAGTEVIRMAGTVELKKDETNQYMRVTGGSWGHFGHVGSATVEADRPIELDFQYKAAIGSGAFTTTIIRNCDNFVNPVIGSLAVNAAVTTWTDAEMVLQGNVVNGAVAATPTNQQKSTSSHPYGFGDKTLDVERFFFMIALGSKGNSYIDIDNVNARPYYKVSFYDADGTTLLYSKYVDPDETSYNVPAEATALLDADRYEGYALKGTTAVVTSAALANKDLEFVAKLKAGSVQYKTGLPGVNVFTGDLEAYGFEDPAYKHTSIDPRTAGVATDPDNANNKVLHIGATQYSHASLTPIPVNETNTFYPIQFEVTPEDTRPFVLSFDVKANTSTGVLKLRSGQDNKGSGWKELKTFTGLTSSFATKSATITMAQMKSSLGYPLMCFTNEASTASGYNFYIDNMKLVPYYRVAYYDADGTTLLHTEYFTPDTQSVTVSATAAAKLDSARYEGFALRGETTVSTSAVTLNYSDVEYVAILKPGAVQYKPGMPGINLWTGSLDAYGFEDITDSTKGTKFTTASRTGVAVKAKDTDTDNQTMMIKGSFPHFTMIDGYYPAVEADRPVVLSFDYFADGVANIKVIRNAMNKTAPELVSFNTTANSWKHQTNVIKGSNKAVTNAGHPDPYKDDTQDIKYLFIMKAQSPANNGDGTIIYIDNVSIVPYYKVTYYDYDNTLLSVEYVAPDQTKFTVPTLNSNYKGYALKGTTDVVTEVNLNYQDLEFVAVLKDASTQVVTPASATGYQGKTTDVDFRFPGVSYTFAEAIAPATIGGASEIPNAKYWELSTDGKTLTVYPEANKAADGVDVTFGTSPLTEVKTTSGKFVKFPEVTLEYASKIPNDYQNLIPFGNMEGAYIPVSVSNSKLGIVKEAHTDAGKTGHYAAVRYTYSQTEPTSGIWAYARTPVAFDEGGTYKIYADLKILGGALGDTNNGSSLWDNPFYAGANHNSSAVATADRGTWKTYEREITTTGLTTAQELVQFYSNPYTYNGVSNGNVTEYAIDNLEVYKRVEVKFEAGEFAPLKSGASNPTMEGKYLYTKGGVPNADAKITLPTASDYYEATDSRRSVSGWIGSNGVEYADGAEVNLADTLAITFEPNLVAAPGYKFITVKFEGNVNGLPEAIGKTLEGDTIDLTKYYTGVTSAVTGKRFNGWSLTGEPKDIIDKIVIGNDLANSDDEIVVKAVVNYDWNFAIPANQGQNGWAFNSGTLEYKDNMMIGNHTSGGTHDEYFSNNTLAIPGGRIQSIIFMLDDEFTFYNRKDHSATTPEAVKIVTTNNTSTGGVSFVAGGNELGLIECLYFGQGHTRKGGFNFVNNQVASVSDGLAKLVIPVYDLDTNTFANSNWSVNKVLTTTDLDTKTLVNNQTGEALIFDGIGVRYIHYKDYPKYDKTVTVTDLTAPVTGATPDTEAAISHGTIKSLEWNDLSAGGLFKEKQQYEFTVTLTPEAGKRYADDTVFTLAGATATSAVINNDTDGTATVTFKYDTATDPYKAFDFDLTTVTDTEITSAEPIQLAINVTEEADAGVDTTIIWSIVEGEDVATITEDGMLTVYKAGKVTVKAVSAYNENKAYTKEIEITLGSEVKSATITFAGDLETVPAAITRLAGTKIDITEYYNVTASATAKADSRRFNGWSTTGKLADLILTDEWTVPAEDTTLYAIVNHDANFAIPANVTGLLGYSRGSMSMKDGMAFAEYTKNWAANNGQPGDVFFTYTSAKAPMADYKGIVFYLADDYTSYSTKAKEDPTPSKFSSKDTGDAFYFATANDSHYFETPQITKITGADGKDYAAFTAMTSANANWVAGNRTNFIRLDHISAICDTYARYLRFIPYDKYTDDIEITFEAPATGAKPGEATANAIGEIVSFTVEPATPAESGLYEGAKAYTATAVIAPADSLNYRFKDDVKVTIGGVVSTDVTKDINGVVTAKVTFPATDPYIDFDVVITGEDSIVTDGTPVQYTGSIVYADPNGEKLTTEELLWSVDDESVASFDAETGILTPYKAGTVNITAQSKYNLAKKVTKPITITLAADVNEVQVKFTGTDLASTETVTRLSGTTLDLTDFLAPALTAEATAAGKRFNGWTLTGEVKDLITDSYEIPADAEGEITFYAVVNHDINFAVPANHANWNAANGTVENKNGMLAVTADTAAKADIIIENNHLNIADVNKYAIVEFYLDKKYSISNTSGRTTDKLLGEGFVAQGIYFSRTEEPVHGSRNVGGEFTGFAGANDEFAVISHPMYTHASWNGTLTRLRFDILNEYCNYSVRYIRFVEAEAYDEDLVLTVTTPVTAEEVKAEATVNEIGTVKAEWKPAEFATAIIDGVEHTYFAADKAYTAVLTVKAAADSSKRFASDITATVNGEAATVTSVSVDGRTAIVEYTFPETGSYVDYTVSITGDDAIETDGTPVQYTSSIQYAVSSDTIPNEAIMWSVDNTDVATIDADTGLLHPITAGTVNIKATSAYNTNKFAEKSVTITISPDAELVKINLAGDGIVAQTNVAERIAGTELKLAGFLNPTLSAEATAAGKRFNGWSTTGKLADLVTDKVTVTDSGDGTMTLYAIVNYDWNFAIEANKEHWAPTNSNATWENGRLVIKHRLGAGADITHRVDLPAGKYIPIKDYMKFIFYYEDEYVFYNDANHTTSATAKLSQVSGDLEALYYTNSSAPGTWITDLLKLPDRYAVQGADGVDYVAIPVDMRRSAGWNPDYGAAIIRLDWWNAYYDAKLRYVQVVPYSVYEDDITVTFDAPATGESVGTATVNEIGKLDSFTIDPDVSGMYAASTAYTATAVISPANADYRFKGDVKVTIGGVVATDVTTDKNGVVTAKATFAATDPYIDFDIAITGEDSFVTDGSPVQYTADIVYTNSGDALTTEEVTWSVDNTAVASIDENGVLTPHDAGTVKVKATSKYNPAVSAEKTVTIALEDGANKVVITLTGADLAAPITVTRISGSEFDLTDYLAPEISAAAKDLGKRFNGWSTTGNLADLINDDKITVTDSGNGTMTLYAIVNHDVNFAIPANQSGWSAGNGTISFSDNQLRFTPNMASPDIRVTGPTVIKPSIDGIAYVEVYLDKNYKIMSNATTGTDYTFGLGATIEGIYFSRTGEKDAGDRLVAGKITGFAGENGEYAVATHEVYKHDLWTGALGKMRFDPMQTYYNYGIRYIRFVEAAPFEHANVQIELNAPATGVAVDLNAAVSDFAIVESASVTPSNTINYVQNGVTIQNWNENTSYTVELVISPNREYPNKFRSDMTATVNGNSAAIVIDSLTGKATVTYTFPTTEALKAITVTGNGPAEITAPGRATQYTAIVTATDGSAIPTTSVTWSLAPGNETYAAINAVTGALLPLRNGTITVIATSNYDATTTWSQSVVLKNQNTEAVVYYNTTGGSAVTPTAGAGVVTLTSEVPTRDGYSFAGWALTDESIETVTSVYVAPKDDENLSTTGIYEKTVYAVWHKIARAYEFNNTDEGFISRGIQGADNSTFIKNPEYFEVQTGNYYDIRFPSGSFTALNAKNVTTAVARVAMSEGAVNQNTEMFLNKLDGAYVVSGKITSKSLDDWQIVTYDLTSNANYAAADSFNAFWWDPMNNVNATIRLDYLRFLDTARTVSYDKNATDHIVLPDDITVQFGDTFTASAEPVRDGYKLVGWSKTADGSTGIKKTYTIVDDLVLYAIWEESVTTVESDGSIVVGAIDPAVHERLVVETTMPGAVVTLYDETGAEVMTATADSTCHATFDLTGLSAPIANATVAPDAGNTLVSATLTDAATAEAITKVETSTEDTGSSGSNSSGSSGGSGSTPSTKVETVTKPGTIDPSKLYPEEEEEEAGEEEFVFNGYPTVKTDELPFVDVNDGDWFYDEVYAAYKLGMIEGKSAIVYDPDGDVTIAEAITFALRLHCGYYGKVMPAIATEGDWYAPIVDAALEAGIIKKAQFTEYNVPALRKQVAAIMAKCVPSEYLKGINMFYSVPDVNKRDSAYGAILKLYKAGIVIGSDAEHNFYPETKITRAEMAAIINRIAVEGNRKRVVTAEELEARKKTFYAEDLVAGTDLGNCYEKKLVMKDGYASGVGKSTDPIVTLTPLVPDLNGAETTKITVGLKTTAKASPQIFFTIPNGGWAANRMLSGKQGATKADGVVEWVFDTKSNSQFANKITGIRFDPFNAKDIEFSIAYIIFE